MINIVQTNPLDADVGVLISELDTYQLSIYPAESNHLDPVEELTASNIYFVGAYDENLIGIGAIKYLNHDCQYGEVKRVYVSQTTRGRGVSKLIMEELEHNALNKEVYIIRLETGIYQPEAFGLYEKLGYSVRNRFGDYLDDPMSVFMEKNLR